MNAQHKLALMLVSCCWLNLAHGQEVDWPNYLGGKERELRCVALLWDQCG